MAQMANANPQSQPPLESNWWELLSKTANDLAQFARAQIELQDAILKHIVEAQIGRTVGVVAEVVMWIYGLLLLLGGIVLLAHLWLEWWLALFVASAIAFAGGVVLRLLVTTSAER